MKIVLIHADYFSDYNRAPGDVDRPIAVLDEGQDFQKLFLTTTFKELVYGWKVGDVAEFIVKSWLHNQGFTCVELSQVDMYACGMFSEEELPSDDPDDEYLYRLIDEPDWQPTIYTAPTT